MDDSKQDDSTVLAFVDKWYPVLAAAVLALALFNLTFRLGSEFVTEWDELLYGQTAWEILSRGSWLGTTFYGQLDYYNTKPPLLVWLIALSFKAFGANLVSLRLASVVSAWLTVALTQHWTNRCFGRLPALLAGLTLATTFGFVYVHSGRAAATDALFTLLMVLTVMVTWSQIEHPMRRVWLGPILAAGFLLRGTAVLFLLAFVATAFVWIGRTRKSALPTMAAAVAFLVPVAAWVIARYRFDGVAFLGPMVMYDFVARTLHPIEDHPGRWYYYLKIFQQHHYDWLFGGVVAILLTPASVWSARLNHWRRPATSSVLLAVWVVVSLAVPMAMQTKVPWYLKDRKSTRLNSSHVSESRMPSSA